MGNDCVFRMQVEEDLVTCPLNRQVLSSTSLLNKSPYVRTSRERFSEDTRFQGVFESVLRASS